MVGFSGLFSLLFALLGALAGSMFGARYHFILAIVGAVIGGSLGIATGAIGWGVFDHLLEKFRRSYESRRYLPAVFWMFVSLGFNLSGLGGIIWLLNLSMR